MANNFGPGDVWRTFLGDVHGTRLQLCLSVIASVPRDELNAQIDQSLHDIERESAFGPLFHPSAYVDGKRWENAKQYSAVLKALKQLRAALPDAQTLTKG